MQWNKISLLLPDARVFVCGDDEKLCFQSDSDFFYPASCASGQCGKSHWNRDSVEDEKIIEDLSTMSKKLLNTSDLELADVKGTVVRQQFPAKQKTQRRNISNKRH